MTFEEDCVMEYLLTIGWEFFVNILETSLFYIYINNRLKRNSLPLTLSFFLLTFRIFVITLINISSFPIAPMISISFGFFMELLFAILLYTDSITKRIFTSCMFSVMALIAERITLFFPHFSTEVNINEFLYQGKLRYTGCFIYLSILAFFVFIMTHVTSKKIYMSLWYRITLLIICSLNIIASNLIQTFSYQVYSLPIPSYIGDWIVYINIAFISLFLLLLFYIYRLGISQANYQRLLMEQKQVEMETQQREAFLEASQSIRETKHDLKNHILILQSLLQSASYDEMASYLSQLSDDIPETSHLIYSGNRSLDSVLTIKLLKAKNAGITVTSSLYLPDKLTLGDLELCSIFGNLLDNAVEACLRLPDSSDRWLRITIREQNTMLLFLVENSSNGNYQYDKNHHLISSKAEQNHGLGLHRVHTLVKRVDGILDIKPEADMFSISILLPIKQEDHKNYAN